MGKSKAVGIKVIARFRPIGDPAKHLNNHNDINFKILEAKSVGMKSRSGNDLMFHLDTILGDTTTQEQMFEAVGEPITRDVLNGYNGTVFVYGQTGSGKTHSLFGDMAGRDAPLRGIIPRSCNRIFEHFQTAEDVDQVTIQLSFVEIYLEGLQDLLEPKNNGKLKIRQRADKSIFVEGLHQEFVTSFDDVYDLLQIGFRNRVVASTKMNSESSRSHCVLILNIKQTLKGGTVKRSKINFADLAGSEKVKKTGATADTLEQAKAINKSLSALGNVISALTSKKKGGHIPFRTSKLTHLLKDALEGNTKTTLVVACSSDIYNSEETVTTLRFASRAKQITNKVTANKEMSVKEMQLMIKVLKAKVHDEQAVNKKLLAFLEELKSDANNPNTPKIQDFVAQLALEKPESKKKGKNTKQKSMDTEDEEAKEEDMEEDSMLLSENKDEKRDSELREETKAVNYELVQQMERLREELDARDKVVDKLNEEVILLKQQAVTKRAREAFIHMVEKRMEQKLVPSIFSDEGSAIKERSELIDRLTSENEQLREDKARLMEWNAELKDGIDAHSRKMKGSKLAQPMVRRSQLLQKSQIQSIQEDAQKLEVEIQKFARTSADLNTEKEELKAERERLQAEYGKLEEPDSDEDAFSAEAERERARDSEAMAKLDAEKAALESEAQRLTTEFAELEKQRAVSGEQIKAKTERLEAERKEFEMEIRRKTEQLELERRELQEAVAGLVAERRTIDSKTVRFDSEIVAGIDQIADDETLKSEAQQQLEAVEAMRRDETKILEAEILQLIADVERLVACAARMASLIGKRI